jgi:hypothetical protein
MFKIKFLRNIVLMSMALAIALPIYNVFIAYPAFMKSLMEDKKAEAARIATHLKNILVTREAVPDGGPPLVDAEAVDVMRGDFDLVKIKVFSADGRVLGAFEIYYDITAVKGRYEDSWPALPPSSSSWPWGWWRPCL